MNVIVLLSVHYCLSIFDAPDFILKVPSLLPWTHFFCFPGSPQRLKLLWVHFTQHTQTRTHTRARTRIILQVILCVGFVDRNTRSSSPCAWTRDWLCVFPAVWFWWSRSFLHSFIPSFSPFSPCLQNTANGAPPGYYGAIDIQNAVSMREHTETHTHTWAYAA